MVPRKPILLLAAIAALVIAAIAVLLIAPTSPRRHSEEFQRLLGGMGFGPALDLSRCPFDFDPRFDEDCDGSLPEGSEISQRGSSIFWYPRSIQAPAPPSVGSTNRE